MIRPLRRRTMSGREEARQCYEGGDVEADLAVNFFFGNFRKIRRKRRSHRY